MSHLKDLTEQKIGNLYVIERAPNYIQPNGRTRVRWRCLCDCGKEYIADGSHLLHGDIISCGCVKNKKTAERCLQYLPLAQKARLKDLTGQKFNMLTVLWQCGHDSSNKVTWFCKCECGNYKEVSGNHLVRGSVKSCGCMISKGEYDMRSILLSLNINFTSQYAFTDLLSLKGNPLRFDFAIRDKVNNLVALVEYQGEQHNTNCKGSFGRQQREETDAMKLAYCIAHDIPLFYIWYYDNLEFEILKILCRIAPFLQVNSVPSSEKEKV